MRLINIKVMNTITLLAAQLFALSYCSNTDICTSQAFLASKYSKSSDCHKFIQKSHEEFTLDQLKSIGRSSDVCKHFDTDDLKNLMYVESLKGNLIEVLPFNCIKDIASIDSDNFDMLFDEIQYENERVITWFTEHADKFCEFEDMFADTAFEDDLKRLCFQHKTVKNRQAIENFERLAAGMMKGNSASSQSGISAFISIFAIAMLAL